MFSRLYKTLSIFGEALLLIVVTLLGTRAIDAVSRYYDTSFHTISLGISFVLSFLLHFVLRMLGQLAGGLLHKMQLIGIDIPGKAHIREKNHFFVRERLPEMEISRVLMAPSLHENENAKSADPLVFYFLGGCLLDLIFTILSFILLKTGLVPCESFAGSFLFSFFLSGLWMFVVFAIPFYRSGQPNDGLKALMILTRPSEKALFYQVMTYLGSLSDGEIDPVENNPFTLSTEPFETDDPLSIFAAMYLFRAYEQAIWSDRLQEADHLLSLLYQHKDDLPEEMREALTQEAIFCLSKNSAQDSLELSDVLMTEQRLSKMEKESTVLSGRSLYQWSLHHLELEDKKWSYLERIKKQLGFLPFQTARKAWMGTIEHG